MSISKVLKLSPVRSSCLSTPVDRQMLTLVRSGRVFSFPVHQTWEFTSDSPIRSVFPLWPIYGWPMTITQWLFEGVGYAPVKPAIIFWIIRTVMFMFSFVFEDWAIHELISNSHQRRQALLLVASSYVTLTWQTHTFSNAVETVMVLWSLVLMKRILDVKVGPYRKPSFSDGVTNHEPHRSGHLAALLLGSLIVCGVFNRITFPAFLLLPGLLMIPLTWRRYVAQAMSEPLSSCSPIMIQTFRYHCHSAQRRRDSHTCHSCRYCFLHPR